jgi:quercetin dioxygenase-like cupin family protein
MNKKVTRLYTGPDGESHFEDTEIPLFEKEGGVRQSKSLDVKQLYFREWDEGHETGWHTAPRRQLVITLAGAEEIEVGDGTKRVFGPGDILLAEDTTGRGHKARSVNGQFRKGISISLA